MNLIGISAISKWQEKYDRTHKFTTTDKSKVKLEFQKIQYNGMYLKSYSRVKFTAQKEGETKIYIYKDGDVIGIIELTIIPKLKGIKLDKQETYFKLKEGKKLKLKIIEGVGKYKLTDYDKEILEASVSSNGELEITGKKEGKTWLRIVDKYNQYLDLKIKVKKI